MVGKFTWGNKAKHCWVMTTNFLFSKVCWQRPAMVCLYTSSKLSCPWFEFSLTVKVMGSNPSHLLKPFPIYHRLSKVGFSYKVNLPYHHINTNTWHWLYFILKIIYWVADNMKKMANTSYLRVGKYILTCLLYFVSSRFPT